MPTATTAREFIRESATEARTYGLLHEEPVVVLCDMLTRALDALEKIEALARAYGRGFVTEALADINALANREGT